VSIIPYYSQKPQFVVRLANTLINKENEMNDLYELFETDDPSQMTDRLMELIREASEAHEDHSEDLLLSITEMVEALANIAVYGP
tara:strand:+ start:602 stop:856 length:255 start_codon:yes stop_codon:yes gene_type:complete